MNKSFNLLEGMESSLYLSGPETAVMFSADFACGNLPYLKLK
jgi:hypothetical protein